MDPNIAAYFMAMNVNPDMRERVESVLNFFASATGGPPQNALVTPARDFIGNPCHELWFFSDRAMMNSGMLVKRAPSPRYDIVALQGRVTSCLINAKQFDMAYLDTIAPEPKSELSCEVAMWGRIKPIEIKVEGPNCKQLGIILRQHILRNLS
ncbi:MAG: hypothetical protein IT462_16185 [Planctomycetes bacterium]|nr:hypothetical protein [Planctomycetota bacterium]